MGRTYATASELGIDVFDPRVYRRHMPWAAFAKLRADAPVCWHEEPEIEGWPAGPGYWAVTRWEDIREVGRQPQTYSSWLGGTQLRTPEGKDLEFWREMLLNLDPPEHTRLRRILGTAFTVKVINRQEPTIRQRSQALLELAISRDVSDFAEDIAAPLPLMTITDVMGLPQSDRRLLLEWTDRVIGFQDEELVGAGAADAAGVMKPKVNPRSREALSDMLDYAGEVLDRKRAEPGDDLMSILATAEVDGERLSREEFQTFFFLFTIAGNDTTHSALPGGLLALLEHPDQFALLRQDPGLLPVAIEEMLRFAPPVIHFRRTASCDTELAGQPIAEGDKVAVYYSSGNRDERAFPNADRFDIAREVNQHLGFGTGPHLCIGAALARLQLRVFWEEFLRLTSDAELAGEPKRLKSNFINGIKNLPVRLAAAR